MPLAREAASMPAAQTMPNPEVIEQPAPAVLQKPQRPPSSSPKPQPSITAVSKAERRPVSGQNRPGQAVKKSELREQPSTLQAAAADEAVPGTASLQRPDTTEQPAFKAEQPAETVELGDEQPTTSSQRPQAVESQQPATAVSPPESGEQPASDLSEPAQGTANPNKELPTSSLQGQQTAKQPAAAIALPEAADRDAMLQPKYVNQLEATSQERSNPPDLNAGQQAEQSGVDVRPPQWPTAAAETESPVRPPELAGPMPELLRPAKPKPPRQKTAPASREISDYELQAFRARQSGLQKSSSGGGVQRLTPPQQCASSATPIALLTAAEGWRKPHAQALCSCAEVQGLLTSRCARFWGCEA